MAISDDQHLKNTEVPDWVVTRFRQYVERIGGRKEFMKTFDISESYMSLFWNGKRHPPKELHHALGIRLVVQPMVYEDIREKDE